MQGLYPPIIRTMNRNNNKMSRSDNPYIHVDPSPNTEVKAEEFYAAVELNGEQLEKEFELDKPAFGIKVNVSSWKTLSCGTHGRNRKGLYFLNKVARSKGKKIVLYLPSYIGAWGSIINMTKKYDTIEVARCNTKHYYKEQKIQSSHYHWGSNSQLDIDFL